MVSNITDRRDVNRAASISVGAAAFLTSIKLVIGIVSGSLGIMSEALHSGLDMSAAGITYTAVKSAARLPILTTIMGTEKSRTSQHLRRHLFSGSLLLGLSTKQFGGSKSMNGLKRRLSEFLSWRQAL